MAPRPAALPRREYARAALRDFQPYGDRAADLIAKTEQLLAHIEQTDKDH